MPEREHYGYLEPAEQMRIAAKVNRICGEDVEQMQPDEIAKEAKEIIEALVPLMLQSDSNLYFKFGRSKNREEQAQAATSAGNFNVPIQPADNLNFSTKNKVENYRIGGYVARKVPIKYLGAIYFEPFFGAGGANLVLEQFPQRTQIEYDPDTLEVTSVTKHEANVTRRTSFTGKPVTNVLYTCKKYVYFNIDYFERRASEQSSESTDARSRAERIMDNVIYVAGGVSWFAFSAAMSAEIVSALK